MPEPMRGLSHQEVALADILMRDGFAFVPGVNMRIMLEQTGSMAGWDDFAASWNDLVPDAYMADKGRYRQRRHAVFLATPDGIARQPHQPHFQTLDYNPLNGGIERWFEPIGAGQTEVLQTILTCCHDLFGNLAPAARHWRVEAHQFRIEARPGEAGKPTPEGMHRDGVDYVMVLLIARKNIRSGITMIESIEGKPLGHFTLTHAFDAAFVADRRVAHGVTPVEPIDSQQPAYRDVLVVTFKAQ